MTLLVLILLMCMGVESQQDEQLHDLNYRCAQDQATVMESVLIMQNRMMRHEEEVKAQIANQAQMMESQMEIIKNKINEILQNQQVTIPQVAPPTIWTVIQRRVDGQVSFHRTWQEYEQGFGEQDGSFWIGLEKLHQLTKDTQHVLHVDVTHFNGLHFYAEYDNFRVDAKANGYKLHATGYSGTAGDGLHYHNGMRFDTKDREVQSGNNCASRYFSGWWFNRCFHVNLNGLYREESHLNETWNGTIWATGWHDSGKSLKFAQMKIRPF